MRGRLLLLAAALAGLAAGAALSLWQSGQPFTSTNGGPPAAIDGWRTDLDIGSAASGLMVQARTARQGLFAMRRSEAVYYGRADGPDSRPLDPNCTYRISGGPLPAEWWSLTVYDEDHFLVRNTDGAASVNADAPGFRSGEWSATLSPVRPDEGAWLSTRGAGHFDLTLRLYQPDLGALAAGPAFPVIETVGCSAEAAL